MRDLSDFYREEYLTESASLDNVPSQDQTLLPHPDVDAAVENDDLEFELGDGGIEETYYAGGDEGDSRNKVSPKIKKKKCKKSMKKESFQNLYSSILNEEFDEYDVEDDFEGDFETEDEGTVEISVSVVRDLISQLEGLVGGEEEYDDFEDDFEGEYEDDFEDDEFPTESWDGGNGDQRLSGDYSGKAKSQKGSNLSDKGKVKVGAKPNSTEGKTGDERLKGDTSGKARRDKGTTHLKGGKNANKASGKTKHKKTPNPEEDLFGV